MKRQANQFSLQVLNLPIPKLPTIWFLPPKFTRHLYFRLSTNVKRKKKPSSRTRRETATPATLFAASNAVFTDRESDSWQEDGRGALRAATNQEISSPSTPPFNNPTQPSPCTSSADDKSVQQQRPRSATPFPLWPPHKCRKHGGNNTTVPRITILFSSFLHGHKPQCRESGATYELQMKD